MGQEDEGQSYVPRLFRNAPGLFHVGRVHEQVFTSLMVRAGEWGLELALGQTPLKHHGYTKALVQSRGKLRRNLRLLLRAVEELPNEPNLLMNLGLELVRGGQLAAGLDYYLEAFAVMSDQPPQTVPPELREELLTQVSSHLSGANRFAEVVSLLRSPLAKTGGLSASLHFTLGLALLRLGQAEEAAEQFRQCLARRDQPGLAPINKDIRTGAPHHCLALCLARLAQPAAADKEFRAAWAQTPSRLIGLDYARFQAGQGRPLEALKLLHELVGAGPQDTAAWELGGQIALSRPEFRGFAADWTGEAYRYCPQHAPIIEQRAEALLLNQQAQEALTLWRQVPNGDPIARAAVVILCQLVVGAPPQVMSPSLEGQVSAQFIRWYRRLLEYGAVQVLEAINQRLGVLSAALPTAAGNLQAALAEAART